jgi:hypothetical protein
LEDHGMSVEVAVWVGAGVSVSVAVSPIVADGGCGVVERVAWSVISVSAVRIGLEQRTVKNPAMRKIKPKRRQVGIVSFLPCTKNLE